MTDYLYYITQSDFSCPGDFEYLYDTLPTGLPTLRDLCSQFFLHFSDANFDQIKAYRQDEAHCTTRYVRHVLKCMVDKGSVELSEQFSVNRPMGICRDSALLFCSMLRFMRIPARLRVGFASYYKSDSWVDGFCCEFFNADLDCWQRVDVRMNNALSRKLNISPSVSVMNISDDDFMLAPLAWQNCRSGLFLPNDFKSLTYSGFNVIRNRMLQDFVCLLKIEPLLWDVWGMMRMDCKDDLALLDQLSEILLFYSDDLMCLQKFYASHHSLQYPNSLLVDHPYFGSQYIDLSCMPC